MCLPDVTGKVPEKNQPLHTGGEVHWITASMIIFLPVWQPETALLHVRLKQRTLTSVVEKTRSQKGVTAVRPISKLYKLTRLLRYLYKAFTTAATYQPENK